MPKDINEKWTGNTAQSDPNILPQAVDDNLNGVSEDKKGTDALLISVADLLANDKGGEAKTLYSVESTTGALVSISADGLSVLYDTNGKFDSLAAGQSATDTFNYTIKLANGALSTAKVTLDIVGVNDAATISGTKAGAVTEDGTLAAGGTLSVTDVDTGENVFQAVDAAVLQGDYGKFSFDAASGMWGFDLDNAKAQALAGGQTVTETLTVKSKDGTATETVEIAVQGVNDAATISGTKAGAVTEDGTLTASGTLSVSDVDTGENVFQAVDAAVLQREYGKFSFDAATGVWGFDLDNAKAQALRSSDIIKETLTVTSKDGTEETIEVTINGADDGSIKTVGYYEMTLGRGEAWEPISTGLNRAELTGVNMSNLSASDLANVDKLFVTNASNWDYGSEYRSNLAAIDKFVFDGGVLVVHDRYVEGAESILPGLPAGVSIVRDFTGGTQINYVNDSGQFAMGSAGTSTDDLNDKSLDNGSSSNHGFAVKGTFPNEFNYTKIHTTDNDDHLVTLGYEYGKGSVLFSSIPLDHYMRHDPSSSPYREIDANFDQHAMNVLLWLKNGADLDLA